MTFLNVFSPDIDKTIALLDEFPTVLNEAKRSALSSAGYLMIQEAQRIIESEGEKTWEGLHPFTLRYRVNRQVGFRSGFKPHGEGQSKFFKRGFFGKPTAFRIFGRFARYLVFRDQVMLGFSTQKNPSSFNPKLERVVARIQEGETIHVTPKMRRFFGASGFPLRKSTTQLRVPGRPIEKPAFQNIKGVLPLLFEKKLFASLKRKTKLIDGEAA